MENSIGDKIKYFRKRENISQMELEIRIGSSSGAVSRIEQGRINPKKETLRKIADALGLKSREREYLYGAISKLPRWEEVLDAKAEISSYFDKKVLAYLIDDRWHLIKLSNYFAKMLDFSESDLDNIYGKCLIELIVNKNYPQIQSVLSDDALEDLYRSNFRYFYHEISYMVDDLEVVNAIKEIKKNPIAKKIWDEIIKEENVGYEPLNSGKVFFQVAGIQLPFVYHYETLLSSDRFQVVEFKPENKFVGVLQKLIG